MVQGRGRQSPAEPGSAGLPRLQQRREPGWRAGCGQWQKYSWVYAPTGELARFAWTAPLLLMGMENKNEKQNVKSHILNYKSLLEPLAVFYIFKLKFIDSLISFMHAWVNMPVCARERERERFMIHLPEHSGSLRLW